jgi:hypothetical protein
MSNQEQSKKRGFYDFQQPLSKTQPGKASDYSKGDMSGNKNTEHRDLNKGAHDFNYKAKVTNSGGNFHDFGNPQAGLKFNGAQKDASMSYLKERNMKGQEVRNFTGGNEKSRLHTHNGGVTAYNAMPVRETYTPATSHNAPPPDAIIHNQIAKSDDQPMGNQTKLGKQIRDHKK